MSFAATSGFVPNNRIILLGLISALATQPGLCQENYYPASPEQQSAPPAASTVFQTPAQASEVPSAYLQQSMVSIPSGTGFRVVLNNTLDSGSSQIGQEFAATVCEPIIWGAEEIIPAGSKLVGQVTHVVCAKSFRFSKNGSIDVCFATLILPDGRRFPMQASVDSKQLRRIAGQTGNRLNRSIKTTALNTIAGAVTGVAVGAIYGAVNRRYQPIRYQGITMARRTSSMASSIAWGAVIGSATGSMVGLVRAGASKGSEVTVPAGLSIPVILDSALELNLPGSLVQYVQPVSGISVAQRVNRH